MRNKPALKPDSSQSQNQWTELPGCLWTIFVVVGGYFIIRAMDRVWYGQASRLDQMICSGVLAGFVILLIWAKRDRDRDQKKLREAQQAWKRTCRSVEVAIVNRKHYSGGWWEDDYGTHSSRSSYHLDLEVIAEQRVLFPTLQSVSVEVEGTVYSKLKDRNVVRIYYQPDSPMIFLLDEELE